MQYNERVRFTMIHMKNCCGALLCWVNPRMPNYCPECGTQVLIKLQHPENIVFTDDSAFLKYTDPTAGLSIPKHEGLGRQKRQKG